MTIKIKVERDYITIDGQTVYRPENIIPGDWLEFFDRLTDPDLVRNSDLEKELEEAKAEIKDLETANWGLEDEVTELRDENRDLENHVENLELEIERLGEGVE